MQREIASQEGKNTHTKRRRQDCGEVGTEKSPNKVKNWEGYGENEKQLPFRIPDAASCTQSSTICLLQEIFLVVAVSGVTSTVM